MLKGVVKFAGLASLVASSPYEKPPCQADEISGQLASGATLCAPKCSDTGTCSMDVPSGVTAEPQCALRTSTGDEYCALVCKAGSDCPVGGQCTKAMPFMPSGVCTYPGDLASTTPSDAQSKFEEFGAAFGRLYNSPAERQQRFGIFSDNLGHIEKMQSLDSSARYSHKTPFADWSVSEFSARNTLNAHQVKHAVTEEQQVQNTSLPDSFDWRQRAGVNDVKDQGMCGSCWAFSTVANIEGVNFVTTQKLVSLSEQELVDCDHNDDHGCQGGLPSNAFKYMVSGKVGLETESVYPYVGIRGGKCHQQKADEVVFISGWKQISTDENQIAAALIQYGPLSIGINAGPMQWYQGGIADPWSILCNPKSLDHGVAIVGFGSETKPYWTIRNSWGPSWGENGYYRIVRGKGKCGLNTMVTTAIIGTTMVV